MAMASVRSCCSCSERCPIFGPDVQSKCGILAKTALPIWIFRRTILDSVDGILERLQTICDVSSFTDRRPTEPEEVALHLGEAGKVLVVLGCPIKIPWWWNCSKIAAIKQPPRSTSWVPPLHLAWSRFSCQHGRAKSSCARWRVFEYCR